MKQEARLGLTTYAPRHKSKRFPWWSSGQDSVPPMPGVPGLSPDQGTRARVPQLRPGATN